MASTSQPHPSFQARPYSSTVHGKLPERPAAGGFGATTSREAQRIERERQERAQREAQPGPSNALNSLSQEQRDEINEAFVLFDLDKDQWIDYHEFKVALKALGFDLPKPEILRLLQANGAPKDGAPLPQARPSAPPPPVASGSYRLNLSGFQNIASKLISERDPQDEILRAFALFDPQGKGMIDLDDLRRVARELGEDLAEDEMVAMIEEFDLNGKGGVSSEEFVQICMG